MAAPTYGAAGTYRQGSSATPAFSAPASVVSTSIVVLDFYLDAGATISSLPSGFAHVAGSPLTVNSGGAGEHKLCRIWARNPAGATYTVTLSANVYTNGQAARADGCVASGDPWDTNSGTGAAAAVDNTNSSGTTPAVSMTTQNADQLLWFSGSNWSGGNWTPPTAGGTWTERLDTGDKTLTVDTLTQATAGATGSVTATCAVADRRAGLLGSLLSAALGGTSLNAGNDAVAATANNASLAVGAQTGNDAVAVAANAATLAVARSAGNDAVSVAANAATLAAAVPAGNDAVAVGAFNASLTVGTQLAAGNAAVAAAANSATLAVARAAGNAGAAVAANAATLAVAPAAGGAAVAVAANAATLAVSAPAGAAAVAVGAFNAALLAGTSLAVAGAAVAVGAFDAQAIGDITGMTGRASGPQSTPVGGVTHQSVAIAGRVEG